MNLDLSELNPNELGVNVSYYFYADVIDGIVERKESISDEFLSWIINPPPIYAAQESEEMKKIADEHAKRYLANKSISKKIAERVRKEVYNVFCTSSSTYKKERKAASLGINTFILSISTLIADKVEIDKASVVTMVAIIVSGILKMGINVACDTFLKGDF